MRSVRQRHALVGMLFFVLGTDLFIISPLIPEIAGYFATTPQDVAAVSVAFGLTYTVLGPFAALFTDQLTRRNAIFIGGVVFAVGELVAGASSSLAILVLSRVVAAVGAALMGAPIWSYVTETAESGHAGAAVALVSGLFAAGQIVGVPAGALIASGGWWQAAFLACGLAALTAALLVKFLLGPELRVPHRTRVMAAVAASLSTWRDRGIGVRIGANFFGQGARVAAYTFAGSIMVARFGFDTVILGLIGAGVGVGSLCGSLFGGWLVTIAQRRGAAQSPISGWAAVVMAVALCSAILVMNPVIAVVSWILTFLAGSCLVSNNQEMIARTAGPRRTYALSWNNSSLYAGIALGTAVLSLVPLGGGLFAAVAAGMALASALCSFRGWPLERQLAAGT